MTVFHRLSFRTKAQLREYIKQLEANNSNQSMELAHRGNELSGLRADVRRLNAKVADNAMLLDELSGQVRTQANIVTSANIAKQEALRQYQVATDRAQEIRGELLTARLELQHYKQQPVSLFDRLFRRDR